jgi:DNA-binding transcriptional MocR family regulator
MAMNKHKHSTGWKPALRGTGPLHEQIVRSLDDDLRSGILKEGSRLPPYRILADRLSVSLGTITKAYALAEQQGLVRGHVGKGTFVLGSGDTAARADDQLIDLSLNIIPHSPAVPFFAEYRKKAQRYPELFETLAYAQPAGTERVRRAAGLWLRKVSNFDADWRRTILTAGAQHAMTLVFGALCRPKETILCESTTFFGLKSLAAHLGTRLHPVQMDEDGIVPDLLQKAAKQTGAKVVYLLPTAHNPTGRTMNDARRAAIVKVAKRLDLWIVEDDLYSLFADRSKQELSPFAVLAPERSFFIGGVSKALAPGLRLGFLVCPEGPFFDTILGAIRATVFALPPFGAAIFGQWVEDGAAFAIGRSVKADVEQRWVLANELLGSSFELHGVMPHVWIPMPRLMAEQISGTAMRAGVSVTSPAAPIPEGSLDCGLRICLGMPSTIGMLKTGLLRLGSVLAPGGSMAQAVV